MASQLLSQQVSSSIEGNNFIDTGKNSHIDINIDACIDTSNITTGDRIDTSSPTPPSIPPPPIMTTIKTRGNRIEDSESVSSPTSSSSSSLQQQRQQQQQLSPRQLLKSGSSSSSSSNNKKQLHVQLKPASSPAPFFTSFEVQNKKCTVYVGNIPFNNDKKPCRICCSSCFDNNYDNEEENNNKDNDNEKKEDEKYNDNDDCEHEKKNKEMEDEDEEVEEGVDEKANNDYDYDKQGCCDCEIELKKFLRERIHAAFKVPMKDIGIRTVRFFSVVTNMYDVDIVNNKNNCDDEDKEEEDDDDVHNNTKHHQKYQQQFRLRRHSAACVEFDDPNNAEYALALKNTAFIYDNDNSPSGSSRTTLRMRRWNTNTNTIESPSPSPPKHLSPKQSSPKQSESQLLLALSTHIPPLPITNNNKSNSTTNNESGGGNNDHDNDNDNDIDTPFESAVHVGNLPSGVVTADDIRLFFFRRMSKAFHGVPPPKIIRIGVRSRRKSNTNNTTTNEIIENDAYVEFQDSRVAYRATILKNRRWYVELHRDYDDNENNNEQLQSENNDNVDNKSNNSNNESRSSSDMERKYSGKINNKDSDTMATTITTTTTQAKNNKKWWKMPMLEIEAWDSNRYEIDNFFLTDDNNANNNNKNNQEENERDDKECLPENNDDEEGSNSDDDPSSLQQRVGNKGGEEEDSDDDNDNNDVMANKNKHAERKGTSRKPPTSSVCTNVVAELRMRGFLICKNEDKIPNLDHLFTTDDGKKEGRLCHGYAFRGKVCRIHNSNKFRRSKSNNNNNNNGNIDCGCAYAHINSFEDIKDPRDQMAVLYYVNNNDDVEFVHGEGCTPQEFLLRQQQQQQEQSKKSEKKRADPVSTNDKMMKDENPQDDKDDQRSIIIRDLEKEVEVICQKLQEEEQLSRTRQEETAVLQNQWRTSQESTEEMLQELRSNLSTVRQELVTTQQELEESKRECASLKNETTQQQQQQQNTTIKNNNKLSPLPDISHLEVSKFKYELQQSQANRDLPEESITEHSFGKSWPCAKSKFSSFDNFLHASVPTLMEMSYKETTNGKTKKVEGRFSPDESRLDLLRTPTTTQNQLSLSASTLFFENSDASPMVMEMHAVDNEMIDRLRSEFALVGSFYGSEEVVMNGISTVTRYLKLPIGGDSSGEKERRYINVDLILTIPNGYPVRGIIGVGTRIPDGDSVCEGSHSGAKIELEHYLSSLLSVCQLEAQVCQGKEALLNILATAENWVTNDDPYPKKEEKL